MPGSVSSLRSFQLLALLWLIGNAIRIPILAIPPVLTLIHDDLHLSETQVGLLVGMPVLLFAAAAIPGSLLVARIGVATTIMIGLVITTLASAGRGLSLDIWALYATTLATGFGIAIVQPALPRLVRDLMPARIGLGTTTYSNGMLVGTTLVTVLTIPVILPLVGHNWRLDLIVWGAPVLMAALLYPLMAPKAAPAAANAVPVKWWPDWKNPVIWLLGLSFGSNNGIYFGSNAFLPDYLTWQGRPDLIGVSLGALNFSQLIASVLLLTTGEAVHRRTWTYLVSGLVTFGAVVAMMFATGIGVVICAAVIGFSTSITFTLFLGMPPVLSKPDDVHRTAAGMFTISYSCAVVFPTMSGALWDLTGIPWTAWLPLAALGITLTALGVVLNAYRSKA